MTCLHMLLMLSALGAPGEASTGGPVQDRFVVGFWLDPPLEMRIIVTSPTPTSTW